MLDGKTILIAEDDFLIADCLSYAVESLGATPLGPVATVHHGLRLVAETGNVDGAILDVGLADGLVTSLAVALRSKSVPVVYHTAQAVPEQILNGSPVCRKPAEAESVAATLSKLLVEGSAD